MKLVRTDEYTYELWDFGDKEKFEAKNIREAVSIAFAYITRDIARDAIRDIDISNTSNIFIDDKFDTTKFYPIDFFQKIVTIDKIKNDFIKKYSNLPKKERMKDINDILENIYDAGYNNASDKWY